MTAVYAVAALLVPVLFILFVALMFSIRAFMQRLKVNHPDKYRELGAPGMLGNGTRESQRVLKSCILGGEDLGLGDATLSRLARRVRTLYYAFIGCFVYVFASAVAMSLGIHGL
jgi:hypothetical protein